VARWGTLFLTLPGHDCSPQVIQRLQRFVIEAFELLIATGVPASRLDVTEGCAGVANALQVIAHRFSPLSVLTPRAMNPDVEDR
jgi:hypothetical protein